MPNHPPDCEAASSRPALPCASSSAVDEHVFVELDGGGIGPGAGVQKTVLAEECALALSFNGISQAVMMVSPHDLEDFALGFSLSNGLVASEDEVYAIELSGQAGQWQADLSISARALWALKEQRRTLAGSSGCGLCGVESIAQALPQLAPLPRQALPAAELFEGLRERIHHAQQRARVSGAMHAAVQVDASGNIRCCREDIGRHNALDKLIGALRRQRMEMAGGFVAVTSRCSLELIHKAIRARVSTLVTLSAPTAMSVAWAGRHGLNLIHLPHRGAPRVYTPLPTREPA